MTAPAGVRVEWVSVDHRIYLAVTDRTIDGEPVEYVMFHYRFGLRKTWYLITAKFHSGGPTAETLATFDQDDIDFRAAYPDMPHAIPGWLVELVAAHVPVSPVPA